MPASNWTSMPRRSSACCQAAVDGKFSRFRKTKTSTDTTADSTVPGQLHERRTVDIPVIGEAFGLLLAELDLMLIGDRWDVVVEGCVASAVAG